MQLRKTEKYKKTKHKTDSLVYTLCPKLSSLTELSVLNLPLCTVRANWNESVLKGNKKRNLSEAIHVRVMQIQEKGPLFDALCFAISQPDTAVEISPSCVCLLFFLMR